jgi:hypothetical protein
MNRRDFLSFGARETSTLEISCERLYMRYLDALGEGEPAVERFLEETERELASARRLRLREAFWLQSEALRKAIEPLLARYRAGGGAVEMA